LRESNTKIIFVAGTNGKTTTAKLLRTVLEADGNTVIQNQSGANLLNGVASTLLLHTNFVGKLKQNYALFEVDESALPLLLKEITPDYLLLLNLFRDQLDRYGEINTIASKWKEALSLLPEKTTLILNADDSQIAYLGKGFKGKIAYFGLKESLGKTLQHAADSVSCPNCGTKLTFKHISFSHLGDWHCNNCHEKRPRPDLDTFPLFPLSGVYNQYNTLAAVLALKQLGITEKAIETALEGFKPAFGRQEIVEYKGKKIQLFLSKNPTSFNQSYATMKELGGKTLLLVLNDRIPDGRDISWIWDADLTNIDQFNHILIAGDRVYDMALRIKYEGYKKFKTFENLEAAIKTGVSLTQSDETFFILPTYSAMLECRKILTGKKIL